MISFFSKGRQPYFLLITLIAIFLLMVLVACSDNTTPTARTETSLSLASPTSLPAKPTPTLITTPVARPATEVFHTSSPATDSATASRLTPTPPSSQALVALTGVEWKLTSYFDGAVMLNPTMEASIQFKVDGTVSGKDGCKSTFWGNYQADNKATIMIGDLQIAGIACPSDPAYTETGDFMNGIRDAKRFEIAGKTLALEASDGTILLLFTAS